MKQKLSTCCLMLMAVFLAISSAIAQTPAIGDNYQGGKVGYILQPSDPGYDPTKIKGLIIGTADYNPKAWAIGNFATAATGVVNTAFGTGAANTAALVTLMGPGDYIAYEFDTLTLNGYTDWYLPSQEEIARILPNYASLNMGSNQIGPGRQTFWYATSTESADDKFNRVYFFTFTSATAVNVQTKGGPGAGGPSRPVRNFEISLCTPTTSDTTITNCGAYNWNGQTYNASGTYTWTGTNAAGCDSTATLNLTISKPAGTEWTLQTVDNPDYFYYSNIAYGNGLFVVVKEDGGTNGVMTSTDGINWTQQTTPDANWTDITYGNGLFVAVTIVGTKRVMTSPDGINWTLQTTPDNGSFNNWYSVTYGNGLFVAVSEYGKSMSSPDGINWTIGVTDITTNRWRDVAYGNGIFVATSDFTTGIVDKVITSIDGVNWTYRSAPITENWKGIIYGNGLFVAVSSGSNGVMTSPDGINWTARNAPQVPNQSWEDVTFGNGLFVAVSRFGNNKVMTSSDGINWTSVNSPSPTGGGWEAVAYGNNRFVAMGANAEADDIMTSIASAACELPCSPTTSITTVTSRGLYGWRGKDYTASGTYSDTLINPAGCEYIPSLNLTILPAITTESVIIGDQTWTTKNLAISHYRNGDPIPQVTDKAVWDTLTTGAWSWYNNDSVNYSQYGKLYNWYAINDPRGFGQANYRMPTVEEYNTLRQTTTKLTEFAQPGINVWNNDVRATNISGFGVYPLGLRNSTLGATPDFNPNGESVDMWTCTAYPFSADSAIQVQLSYNSVGDSLQYDALISSKRMGLPVRLLACTPTTSSTTVISRGLYGWNGVDYTASGTYQKTLVNAAGCDSILTLNLTILPAITTDTVRIGTLVVSTKNLDVTRYRNGDIIPEVRDSATWRNLTTGAWCWVKNDSANYSQYGKLYNWYAVNDARGLAPAGYHIPNQAEATAVSTIYGNNLAAYIAPGINIWRYTSNGTNISGLAAYPAGIRKTNIDGDFVDFKKTYSFWTSAEFFGFGGAGFITWARDLDINFTSGVNGYSKTFGMSVRVIKNPCSPNSSDTTVSACSSYSWNGQTFTSSGIYKDTLTNAGGCDSIATLNLTINLPSSSRDSVVACASYSWNGQTYNTSGTYTWSGTNAAGCDSTATLVLTVKPKLVWYKDADSDGYGTGDSIYVCDQPTGYRLLKDMIAATGDCDDTNATIYPNSSTAATSILASSSTVTVGVSITLSVNGGSLGASDTWKWYTGSCGGTAIGSGTSIVVSPAVTTTYYLRAEGCTNTNCVSVTITACGPTGVTSNAANNTICSGTSTTLTVQGVLAGAASWKWYKNACGYDESRSGAEGAIGTGASLKVSPTSTTTYYVRSEGGICGKTICKSITITVNTKPAKPVSMTVPAKICKQATIQLTVGAVISATSYTWTVPAGWSIVSGQGTRTVVVKTGTASADVKVAAVNSCGSSAVYTKRITLGNCNATSSAVLVTSAIRPIAGGEVDTDAALNIQTYPNPSTNYFTVRNNNSFVIQLRMVQASGQVVEAFSQVQPGAAVEFGARYRPGIYLVEATGNGLKTTKKVIKH